MGARPVIADSAHKHGVAEDDMLHAYRNPIRVFDLDEGLTMIIGAATDGTPLEVGVAAADDIAVIVHAMPARPKFLR